MSLRHVAVSHRRQGTGRFLVLGCGHTGTTLISGILHINGYSTFNVSRLFENTRLNDLNRRILDGRGVDDSEIGAFIAEVERRTSGRWCLKDPRLSETAVRVYPHIPQPLKIILNYRHPGATVRSLIKEREEHESHLSPEEMLASAEEEWLRLNRAALAFLDLENRSPLLITRYDDLVDRGLDELVCRFVGRSLDLSFIEPAKRRSAPVSVRQELLDLYENLNERFEANRIEIFRTTMPVLVTVRLRPSVRTRVHVEANRIVNGVRWRWAKLDRLIRARRSIDGAN